MIKNLSLWKKKDKNGKTFLSVVVEMEDGYKESVLCFENTKTKDTQPDFKYWKKPDEQKQETRMPDTDFDDDPFA